MSKTTKKQAKTWPNLWCSKWKCRAFGRCV